MSGELNKAKIDEALSEELGVDNITGLDGREGCIGICQRKHSVARLQGRLHNADRPAPISSCGAGALVGSVWSMRDEDKKAQN